MPSHEQLPQDTPLRKLPQYWQDQVLKLRSENYSLRKRLKEATRDPKVHAISSVIESLRAELAALREASSLEGSVSDLPDALRVREDA